MVDQKHDRKLLTLTIVAIGMSSYISMNFISDYMGIDSIWFLGNAFAFFMYAIAIRINYSHLITDILVFVTSTALFDEIFGTATEVKTLEYITFIIYILISKTGNGSSSHNLN